MKLEQFCKMIAKEVSDYMGNEVKVEIREVRKNNGVFLTGLFLSEEDGNVAPTIYLDGYYQDYRKGRRKENIALEIVQMYVRVRKNQKIDMEFFNDYEKVKERICFKLIHYQRNEALLHGIPHFVYLNLAVVFYYAYEGKELGKGTILIRNSHMKSWGVTQEELYQAAKENTGRLFPPQVISMEELVQGMMEEEKEDVELFPMYVLTNSSKQFGAAVIMYKEQLEKVAERTGKNLFILPSSVHEVILLPDFGEKPQTLKNMVEEVNETQVAEEEILSDSVYYYDRMIGQIRLLI